MKFTSGHTPEFLWSVCLACLLALSGKSAAQDASNKGTNQPPNQTVPNNSVPLQTFESPLPSPAAVNQPVVAYSLTNELQTLPSPPPITGPTSVGSAGPAAPLLGTSAISGPPTPVGTSGLGAGIPLWGPIDFHPRLSYTLLYGNGVQALPGQQSKTFISEVAPGILFDLGRQWTLDYTPTFRIYSNPSFKDGTDESVHLNGAASYRDWSFRVSQTYASSTQPLIETGAQTEQVLYATLLGASYQAGTKTSLDFSVNQNFRLAQQFSSLHEWTTSDWLNYQAEPQIGLGLGDIGGYDAVSLSSSMPFEQLQGRLNFRPGTKLALSLSGGVEDRQFVGPSAPSLISPIFRASLQYQLLKPTSISLSASRSVTPSYYGNEVQTSTTLNGGVHQQLSQKFALGLSVGYSTTPFTSIEPGALPQYYFGSPPRTPLQVVRNDTTTLFRVSLSYAVTTRAGLSVFYTKSEIASGQSAFSYSSSQGGLSFNYR